MIGLEGCAGTRSPAKSGHASFGFSAATAATTPATVARKSGYRGGRVPPRAFPKATSGYRLASGFRPIRPDPPFPYFLPHA